MRTTCANCLTPITYRGEVVWVHDATGNRRCDDRVDSRTVEVLLAEGVKVAAPVSVAHYDAAVVKAADEYVHSNGGGLGLFDALREALDARDRFLNPPVTEWRGYVEKNYGGGSFRVVVDRDTLQYPEVGTKVIVTIQ